MHWFPDQRMLTASQMVRVSPMTSINIRYVCVVCICPESTINFVMYGFFRFLFFGNKSCVKKSRVIDGSRRASRFSLITLALRTVARFFYIVLFFNGYWSIFNRYGNIYFISKKVFPFVQWLGCVSTLEGFTKFICFLFFFKEI